jgi:hypothetical protein
MTLNEIAVSLRSTTDDLEAASKAAEAKEYEVDTSAIEATLDVLSTDVEGIKDEIDDADEPEEDEDDDDEEDDEEEETSKD